MFPCGHFLADVVKLLGRMMRTKEEGTAITPPPSEDQDLLAEILALLEGGITEGR